MNKVLLVVKREYLTRVRNKTFILSTVLTPLFFIALIGVSTYFSHNNSEELKVAVYDQSGLFASRLKSSPNIHYTTVPQNIYDSFVLKKPVEAYNGLLYIPNINVDTPKGIEYLSEKQLGVFSQDKVNSDLNDVLEQERMIRANIDTARLSEIRRNSVSLSQKIIGEGRNGEADAGISAAIASISALLIYMLMFIYGAMVMRGVMEEKVNRVAELIVSSVKPFQLMMGKILGIGAVGLTQFLIWIILFVVGSSVVSSSLSDGQIHTLVNSSENLNNAQMISGVISDINSHLNVPLLIGAFVFYFIFGYLFYAALFAAVGSAVNEDPQDAQSMMFPITIPIIFSIVIMTRVIGDPTGSLGVWCSIIPFTSPIIMMARLPFGFPGTVTVWELVLSILSLIIGFLLTTWLSAKIYRTGILMYGKKPAWKDLIRWAFRK
ncbi:MAG: ABC transporter permease [Bacteroidetes bacterium]|nr:ABC transporter permease [Bacteroidota bacterium]MBS1739571.1 ABC transporter permease [Bacteroidota bacterium]